MYDPQAEERREWRHRPPAFRASRFFTRVVREACVCWSTLQCAGLLQARCGQVQFVRALFCAFWTDLLAHPAQPLHALDCVVHLVWLDVFKFMNVETFLVHFADEHEGYSIIFSSGWVHYKARQVVRVTITDERVVANIRRGTATRIGQVFDAGSDDFEGIVADGVLLDFRLLATSTAA